MQLSTLCCTGLKNDVVYLLLYWILWNIALVYCIFLTTKEDSTFASTLSTTVIFSPCGQIYLYFKFSSVSPAWQIIPVPQSDFDIWYVHLNSSLTERTVSRGNLSDMHSGSAHFESSNTRFPPCIFVIFLICSRAVWETLLKKKTQPPPFTYFRINL